MYVCMYVCICKLHGCIYVDEYTLILKIFCAKNFSYVYIFMYKIKHSKFFLQ